ncbi:hypothetical protein MES4922_550032 [Mesorhizobium ventifaucium]|uniref:Uncharacterized protein n=2 Tax=Mesorhizobium ventifaucium TaxID=666020 RepID=A0ABM9EC51_9HYPH|nr:hypothetical protein MES4922_550032 [Mesorhizobium ventifaucium]
MPKIIDVELARLRIVKAAGKAIAGKSISAVTMIDIANAAGVSAESEPAGFRAALCALDEVSCDSIL